MNLLGLAITSVKTHHMKKTQKSSAMANAFAAYARLGICMGTAELSYPYLKIFGIAGRNKQLLHKLLAAHECVMFLELAQEYETLFAVRQIYLAPVIKARNRSGREILIRKNEISNRVRRFAYDNHIDERTVYRRLKVARDIFARLYEGNQAEKNA